MVAGRTSAAIEQLNQVKRDLADRKELRDRKAAAVRQQAKDSLQKQAAVAGTTAKHLAELGRRKKEAGGWATERALADRDTAMDFGPGEGEEPAAGTGPYSKQFAANTEETPAWAQAVSETSAAEDPIDTRRARCLHPSLTQHRPSHLVVDVHCKKQNSTTRICRIRVG